jgi:hypothetical protein
MQSVFYRPMHTSERSSEVIGCVFVISDAALSSRRLVRDAAASANDAALMRANCMLVLMSQNAVTLAPSSLGQARCTKPLDNRQLLSARVVIGRQ